MWPFKKTQNTFLNLMKKYNKQERKDENKARRMKRKSTQRKCIEITPGMNKDGILSAVLYNSDMPKGDFKKEYEELK